MSNTQDAFGTFLRQAAKTPLLTHADEVELAHAVRAWLDNPQADALTIRAGQQAKQRMIQTNIRLVVSVAKKHQNRGVGIPDLVQEGCIGLNRAVELFNPQRGYRFSTYAYAWINQAILRCIEGTAKPIRLPNHVHEILKVARQEVAEYRKTHGHYPASRRLAEMLMKRGKLKPPTYHPKGVDPMDLAVQKLEHYLAMARDCYSLEFQVGHNAKGDDPLEIGNLVVCSRPRPEDVAAEHAQHDFAQGLLKQLTPKQRAVIVARYGLDGTPAQPYAKIAAAMGLDTRNVRVMHDRAIRNLRARLAGSDFVELVREA